MGIIYEPFSNLKDKNLKQSSFQSEQILVAGLGAINASIEFTQPVYLVDIKNILYLEDSFNGGLINLDNYFKPVIGLDCTNDNSLIKQMIGAINSSALIVNPNEDFAAYQSFSLLQITVNIDLTRFPDLALLNGTVRLYTKLIYFQ